MRQDFGQRPASISDDPPWQKLGLAFAPPGTGKMVSHAMLPTPMILDDRVRVLFASCDEDLRGRIFFADFDRAAPFRLMGLSQGPVLDLGSPGRFDSDGVNPCRLVRRGDDWHLYYIGWRRVSSAVPYTLLAGVAVSHDQGLSFSRLSTDPILPPRPDEGLFRTAPFVFVSRDGFEMFYIGGGSFFDSLEGKRLPIYALKYHRSVDGITWAERPVTLMTPDTSRGEIGFGRPYLWISSWTGPSLMISVRSISGYKLCQMKFSRGPLHSANLAPVLHGAQESWESEMTCFGAPCHLDDRELLFYCGNGMGRAGFGYAIRPIGPRSHRHDDIWRDD